MARGKPSINPLSSERSRSHTISQGPTSPFEEEVFTHRQPDKEESFYLTQSHSYPSIPKNSSQHTTQLEPYFEKSKDPLKSPGLAPSLPHFAPPPKAHSPLALPTSTFIPNADYPQAGFAASSLAHSKGYDYQQVHFVTSPTQPYFRPAPVEEIYIFNSNEKTLIQANKEMSQPQQFQPPPQDEYHMNDMQQGGQPQMHFDPPPTQAIEQQPDPEQGMTYDQGYAINSNGQPHAPGQISHPNQLLGPQDFKNGLCSCFSDIGSCCLGCWCPCMLYAKTNHRIKTLPNSNLDQYGSCNGHCMMWCALAPVSWIFTTIQRTRLRERYQIKGSPMGDCAKSYCCPVCVLVQDEREIRDREDEKKRCAGPGSGVVGEQGYKKPEKMTYQRSSVIG